MEANHKCSYCNESSYLTRDALVELGWSFADIQTPTKKNIKTCPKHFDEFKKDIVLAMKGTMHTKWD